MKDDLWLIILAVVAFFLLKNSQEAAPQAENEAESDLFTPFTGTPGTPGTAMDPGKAADGFQARANNVVYSLPAGMNPPKTQTDFTPQSAFSRSTMTASPTLAISALAGPPML